MRAGDVVRVLGLIPARGGSRGIPRKNVRLLAGKPLLQYTAEAAMAARRLSRIVVSTDDPRIADVARGCGVEAPFLRPDALAADEAPTLPVVQHALAWLAQHGDRFDAVCLLQPTSPFRAAGEIDACIDLLERSGADTVMTMTLVPCEYNPHWVYRMDPDGDVRLVTGEPVPIPRRQDLPAMFHRDGSVYVSRHRVIAERNSLYGDRVKGLVVASDGRVNIDTLTDWNIAERLAVSRVR